MERLRVERPTELEPELGAPAGIRRRRGRLGEVLGGGRPSERRLGGAELGQHLGTELGGRRLLERALEIADGGLRGAGLARGGAELLDDPLVASGMPEQQVRRDSLDVGALGVQQPRRIEVAAGALEQRDVLLDRVLDERVHEPQRLAREHDLDARERVGRGRGRIDRESRQRCRAPERDVVAEDRDRPGQRRRRRAEPPDPDPERAGDGVRGESAGAARERAPRRFCSSASASSNSCR